MEVAGKIYKKEREPMKERRWMTQARRALGLSQAGLGEKVGVTQRSIAAYESGDRTPTVSIAKNLARVLDVRWEQYYEEEEP